ncbi:MAG: LCP family protein [Anaerolineales bacterium]|nr:LCP family protein [Anaerolineales bacterium]
MQTDHYVSINMRTFEKIINALGGIDVNIKDERASKKDRLALSAPIIWTVRVRSRLRATAAVAALNAQTTRTSSCARCVKNSPAQMWSPRSRP